MASVAQDLVALSDYVWWRFGERMAGLTDDEWAWCPTEDPRVGLRWRIQHLRELLEAPRNSEWLGVPTAPGASTDDVDTAVDAGAELSAAAALAEANTAYGIWQTLLAGRSDEDLASPLGPVAGQWAQDTRRSFALHVLDELVHHSAEAALLRDLYAARSTSAGA